MIEELRLKDFGSITGELLFSPGFNVIVGETGTGKSLLLSSVEFLKGAKSSVSRDGSFVEAVFTVNGEELIVRREVSGGRSRYFLNGRRVPQKVVEEAVSPLLLFQSQRQSVKLLKPSYQLSVLDRISDSEGLLEDYKKLYSRYRELLSELENLRKSLSDREREIDILKYQIEEIETAAIKPGEEEELLRLREVVSRAEKVAKLRQFSLHLLYEGEPSVLDLVSKLIREFEEIELYSEIVRELNEIYYKLESVVSEIEKRVQVPETELSLEEIEDRLYQIERIKRKYGGTLEKIEEFLAEAREKLEKLLNAETDLEAVEAQLKSVERELFDVSSKLSELRKKGAVKLKNLVLKGFKELGLEDARFEVEVEELSELTPVGRDSVRFLFSGNPSLPLSPLSESISGGELSRFLLILLSVVSLPNMTMVFDEIDAGMSGKIVGKVARKLREISRRQQVIAVTHSPQVVAAADRVFKLEKVEGKVSVTLLSGEELERELALMISGEVTEGSLKAAKDLLKKWEE